MKLYYGKTVNTKNIILAVVIKIAENYQYRFYIVF